MYAIQSMEAKEVSLCARDQLILEPGLVCDPGVLAN